LIGRRPQIEFRQNWLNSGISAAVLHCVIGERLRRRASIADPRLLELQFLHLFDGEEPPNRKPHGDKRADKKQQHQQRRYSLALHIRATLTMPPLRRNYRVCGRLPKNWQPRKLRSMRTAFKEWAIVVDALGRGEQILILRKGGIHEGKGGFQVEHPRFWLFPTLFHQQRESVVPAAQIRFDTIAPDFPAADKVRIEFLADVADWRRIESLEQAHALREQHIWMDHVIAERFEWGRNKNIFALALRVFRLPQTVELPVLPSYGGCKSWIELAADISAKEAAPVLDDGAFAKRLERFRE